MPSRRTYSKTPIPVNIGTLVKVTKVAEKQPVSVSGEKFIEVVSKHVSPFYAYVTGAKNIHGGKLSEDGRIISGKMVNVICVRRGFINKEIHIPADGYTVAENTTISFPYYYSPDHYDERGRDLRKDIFSSMKRGMDGRFMKC